MARFPARAFRHCLLFSFIASWVLYLLHLSRSSHSAKPTSLPSETHSSEANTNTTTTRTQPTPPCDGFIHSSDVVLTVKTGANEVYDKLATQLLTTLRCFDDELLIFSDLEQRIGDHHIHDALVDVAEEAKMDNPDFDYYNALQRHVANGQDISSLKDIYHDAAWNLDKYKFLPMLQRAWKFRPGRKVGDFAIQSAVSLSLVHFGGPRTLRLTPGSSTVVCLYRSRYLSGLAESVIVAGTAECIGAIVPRISYMGRSDRVRTWRQWIRSLGGGHVPCHRV